MSTAAVTRDLAALSGRYAFDPAHTRIGFVARHAMVTRVRGSFNEFDGTVHIDGRRPEASTARLVIQAKSIDTRNAERDAHLRSNDFFAMDDYPELRFVSTSVEHLDDEHYRVTGDLTIKDVTKPVAIDFELTGSGFDEEGRFRVGFEGATEVNRRDWNVSWNLALETGGVLVSERIKLEFEVSLVRERR